KLNIASSTASESAMRGRQIVEEHALKLMEEDKFEGRPPYSHGVVLSYDKGRADQRSCFSK
ncbi:hypothetical protein D1BOALGB6SA_2025, partial [Olavius sp. associated proteobacterium Delta 1]